MHSNTPLLLILCACFGAAGYRMAVSRDRSRAVGALVGIVGGLIGLAIYALVTRKPKSVPSAQTELAPIP